MQKSCSIIIATYGCDSWRRLAERRAYPSAKSQGDFEIILHHDPDAISPSAPRNYAISQAVGEWIVNLDADDFLESNYINSILSGHGDIRYPKIRYIPENHPHDKPLPDAIVLPRRNLIDGNFMVVGSAYRREAFLEVGGFREWETYEDWEMLLRLTYAGAVPQLCPGATYRCYKRSGSRVHATRDPIGLCIAIREGFRKWCWDFDGGQTTNPYYRAFLDAKPRPQETVNITTGDRLNEPHV